MNSNRPFVSSGRQGPARHSQGLSGPFCVPETHTHRIRVTPPLELIKRPNIPAKLGQESADALSDKPRKFPDELSERLILAVEVLHHPVHEEESFIFAQS
jgi:hypothetical protein